MLEVTKREVALVILKALRAILRNKFTPGTNAEVNTVFYDVEETIRKLEQE